MNNRWTLLAVLVLIGVGIGVMLSRTSRTQAVERGAPTVLEPSMGERDGVPAHERAPEVVGAVREEAVVDREPAPESASLHDAPDARRDVSYLLVDEDTDEEIPFCAIAFEVNGVVERRLESDGDGRVHLEDVSGDAECAFLVEDGAPPSADAPRVVLIDSGADEEVVRVPMGPTYRVRLVDTLGNEVQGGVFRAALLRDLGDQLLQVDAGASRALREDGVGRWVRFARAPLHPSRAGDRWALSVVAGEGGLGGRASVSTVRGTCPEVVTIELSDVAAVRGHVLDDVGAPVAGIQLGLYARNRSSGFEPRMTTTSSEGEFALTDVPAGEYFVLTGSHKYPFVQQEVELEPGLTAYTDVALRARPTGGSIRGVVVGFGDEAGQRCTLTLRSRSDRSVVYTATPELDASSDPPVGRFAFEDVPEGEYELHALGAVSGYYQPGSVMVRPPAEGVTFAHDPNHVSQYAGFRVTDAETGETVDGFDVSFALESGHGTFAIGSESSVAVLPFYDEPFEWTLTREGYRPRSGNGSVFGEARVDAVAKVAYRFADVELSAGWGEHFILLRNGMPARVVVMSDGVALGTTDEHGSVLLSSQQRPTQLDVYEGGELIHSFDAATLEREPELAAGRRGIVLRLPFRE